MRKLSEPAAFDPMLFAVPARESEVRPRYSHWASRLTGCLRQDYYRWIGARITNPASLIQVQKMEAGEDDALTFSRRLLENASRYGAEVLDLEQEVPVRLEFPALSYPISGRVDFLLTLRYRGQLSRYAIEFKSVAGNYAFRGLIGYETADGWQEGDPHYRLSYVVQIYAYLLALRERIDHAVLIIWDRVSRLHASYEFRLDEDGALWYAALPRFLPEKPFFPTWKPAKVAWEGVLTRLALLEWHVANRIPPERYDPLTGEKYMAQVENGEFIKPRKAQQKENEIWWACADYCEFRDLCWGLVPEEGGGGDELPDAGGGMGQEVREGEEASCGGEG